MLKTNRAHNMGCEQQAKFIQDRILLVEKNFAELCSVFAAYTRKAARLRDKNDELTKTVIAYAESEDVNKSMREGLLQFSSILLSLGDFRDAHVQTLDSKVIGEFAQYDSICKRVKEEVKHTFTARDREVARKRQLDRLRDRNPRSRLQISQAETELVKATAEVSRTIRTLEEQTDEFERRKLKDIKTIFCDFIIVEMGLHAKALELLTKAYRDIDNIDEQADLEAFQEMRGNLEGEFRTMLRMPERASRLDTVTRTSFKHSQSLNSLFSTRRGNELRSKNPMSKSVESIDSFKASPDESLDTIDIGGSTEDDERQSVPIPTARRMFNS